MSGRALAAAAVAVLAGGALVACGGHSHAVAGAVCGLSQGKASPPARAATSGLTLSAGSPLSVQSAFDTNGSQDVLPAPDGDVYFAGAKQVGLMNSAGVVLWSRTGGISNVQPTATAVFVQVGNKQTAVLDGRTGADLACLASASSLVGSGQLLAAAVPNLVLVGADYASRVVPDTSAGGSQWQQLTVGPAHPAFAEESHLTGTWTLLAAARDAAVAGSSPSSFGGYPKLALLRSGASPVDVTLKAPVAQPVSGQTWDGVTVLGTTGTTTLVQDDYTSGRLGGLAALDAAGKVLWRSAPVDVASLSTSGVTTLTDGGDSVTLSRLNLQTGASTGSSKITREPSQPSNKWTVVNEQNRLWVDTGNYVVVADTGTAPAAAPTIVTVETTLESVLAAWAAPGASVLATTDSSETSYLLR